MDIDLKCNNLSCRKTLNEKAVVTTCSHAFCVECANLLFDASSHSCPACGTALSEPDDVVITSLRPTNDYKTSVLSGLSPATILEICNRAIAFWQYQVHQESSYQQAVLKTLNDKSIHLTKQLDNVVREAHGELSILKNKITGLERELDDEKRKNREIQAGLREKDKEYQKLKNQFDTLKRKSLLVQGPMVTDSGSSVGENLNVSTTMTSLAEHPSQHIYSGQIQAGSGGFNRGLYNVPTNHSEVGINRMADSMEAFKIQRTPLKQNLPGTFSDFKRPHRHTQQRAIYDKANVNDVSGNEVNSLLGYHQSVRGIINTPVLGQRGKHTGTKMRNEVRSNDGGLLY